MIGIDARHLLFPLSGLGRFLTGAILEFERRGENIHLFLPSPPTGDCGQSTLDLTARIPTSISASFNPVARAAWGQFTLPALARRAGVNVLWGPAHRLPRFGTDGLAKVLTVHDLVWRHAPGTMRRRTLWGERVLMRQAVASADQVTTVSEATRADLMAQFQTPAERVRCVYPGVGPLPAPGESDVARRHGLARPYALFVGTPEPRKNLARLVAAYRSLAAEHRAACMLVIVGGEGWGDVDPAALAAGMEDDVRVLGRVGDAELSALLAGARFLAMPSLYEGFGLPIIEANAFGVPVLTSSVASMPEAGGDAALYVDPLDAGSIARGLVEMIGDDVLRDRLAGKARANAARFRWRDFGEGMRTVFERALAERRRVN
ncbi:MAG: glycosyl transferase family 1 [Rhizobiales bacterium]|nr:glycosyl transferase family 1 [Hyphomicrobiales bacterium]MBA69213.1 glycosyl transferase family 1 [Hyphomicrobiales bacterium]